MTENKYKEFSARLINAMKSEGYIASRSPSGICMKTLAKFAGASEQICRRYIRGDALPDHDKIVKIAHCLNISPGSLLFGESNSMNKAESSGRFMLDDDALYYVLKESHALFHEGSNEGEDYADFVMGLIQDTRAIDTSKDKVKKIINLALTSISSYKETKKKYRK